MVKLTADLIGRSPFYINAIREMELDLRNNKISAIENLGATKVKKEKSSLQNTFFPLHLPLFFLYRMDLIQSTFRTTTSRYSRTCLV